ncbi:hypothetical protein KSF_052640 [Reticulibacter mediterranei]|uniref:Uncharacterized protein n=1 Tax=Reticulibacter mediterranei TaxID=2778369 RepID=A0A8J3IIK2_9CHLR|nr:hypothetical protein [Reticulibacter mediterranei]GHO95216.1 hypothetical protein KSF_052640 [Reticulibacter mediterranei]
MDSKDIYPGLYREPEPPPSQETKQLVAAITRTLARIKNEQLNRLIEEIDTLYKALDNFNLSMLLTEEQRRERTALQVQVNAVKEAIYNEWGKRLLNGHRLKFKQIVAQAQPQAAGSQATRIIPYPTREGQEPGTRVWMVCTNQRGEPTLFLDGLPLTLEENTLQALREHVSAHMSQHDRYTEVYAVLDLDTAQLQTLVGKAQTTDGTPEQ